MAYRIDTYDLYFTFVHGHVFSLSLSLSLSLSYLIPFGGSRERCRGLARLGSARRFLQKDSKSAGETAILNGHFRWHRDRRRGVRRRDVELWYM